MASYNLVCKKKAPHFYENVDLLRLNSPWYSKKQLIDILENVDKPKFVDINVKARTKAKIADHDFKELLEIVGKYNVTWVGISNVEKVETYEFVRELLGNSTTKICAKVETEKGCDNVEKIIDAFDGVMVDVEDLASEIGWDSATKRKDIVYDLCAIKNKDHFRLSGVIFELIDYKKIVYTYGAFDLLHPGHIKLLETAKSYGDKLIVGVVDDKAIGELKGKDRPVQGLEDRLRIVQSLKCVDSVMVQKDYDPVPNMEKIMPSILIKGDDWDYIPGQEWIEKHGGKLIKPKYSSSWSTSGTVKKIRKTLETLSGNSDKQRSHPGLNVAKNGGNNSSLNKDRIPQIDKA